LNRRDIAAENAEHAKIEISSANSAVEFLGLFFGMANSAVTDYFEPTACFPV
jgi:hypothetical protein